MAALAREGAKSIVTCVSVQQRSIETGIIERNEALSINSQQNPHYYCSVSDANYSGGLTQDRTRHAYMEYTCLDSLFYAGWLLHFFHVPSLITTQLAVSSLLFSSHLFLGSVFLILIRYIIRNSLQTKSSRWFGGWQELLFVVLINK